ncbi:MAG TPA: hypothetical protein DCQ98_00135 [Planctomycetaceae bacterium]|nr:hypothetical protein [Planctomycetaceae bacterium]
MGLKRRSGRSTRRSIGAMVDRRDGRSLQSVGSGRGCLALSPSISSRERSAVDDRARSGDESREGSNIERSVRDYLGCFAAGLDARHDSDARRRFAISFARARPFFRPLPPPFA